MQIKASASPLPVVTYPAIVGKVLAQQREVRGIKQSDLAGAIGLSQSAYSRLESGESVINVAQLLNVCTQLSLAPAGVLDLADRYAAQLRQQGVEIIAEKPGNPAAIAIGLGLLAALLLSGR